MIHASPIRASLCSRNKKRCRVITHVVYQSHGVALPPAHLSSQVLPVTRRYTLDEIARVSSRTITSLPSTRSAANHASSNAAARRAARAASCATRSTAEICFGRWHTGEARAERNRLFRQSTQGKSGDLRRSGRREDRQRDCDSERRERLGNDHHRSIQRENRARGQNRV